jgi:hypothetical protein
MRRWEAAAAWAPSPEYLAAALEPVGAGDDKNMG